jgi:hypothetical protein
MSSPIGLKHLAHKAFGHKAYPQQLKRNKRKNKKTLILSGPDYFAFTFLKNFQKKNSPDFWGKFKD